MKTGMGLLILLCVFLSMAGFARDSNTCSPTGVWYGGSDYKYMLTITPLTEDTFAIQYEAVFANSSFGYNAWTSWQGQLKQQKDVTTQRKQFRFTRRVPSFRPLRTPTNCMQFGRKGSLPIATI